MYFVSLVRKAVAEQFGYGNQLSSSKLKNDDFNILVPMQNGEIAFEYMERFVRQLHTERVQKLHVFLKVSNLSDVKLSKDEENALAQLSGNLKPYLISEILEWQTGISEINPMHIPQLTVSGSLKYPFYGQAMQNNGVISYETLNHSVLNNPNGKPTLLIHSNNQNITYLETPFYLKDGHGATSVLQADALNRHTAFYLGAAISKVIKARFDYNAKATKIALKNTHIMLPEKNGKPDVELMALIGRAVEKLVIADVVAFSEREMAAYEQVIA